MFIILHSWTSERTNNNFLVTLLFLVVFASCRLTLRGKDYIHVYLANSRNLKGLTNFYISLRVVFLIPQPVFLFCDDGVFYKMFQKKSFIIIISTS